MFQQQQAYVIKTCTTVQCANHIGEVSCVLNCINICTDRNIMSNGINCLDGFWSNFKSSCERV